MAPPHFPLDFIFCAGSLPFLYKNTVSKIIAVPYRTNCPSTCYFIFQHVIPFLSQLIICLQQFSSLSLPLGTGAQLQYASKIATKGMNSTSSSLDIATAHSRLHRQAFYSENLQLLQHTVSSSSAGFHYPSRQNSLFLRVKGQRERATDISQPV
jgi:hypothetical protein